MSPEQLEGKDADTRTDIFALGAVLYEMATGKKAFTGNSQASLIAAIISAEPIPILTIQPMTPSMLDRIVKKCLAKDPEDRWQSANDLASELKWIAEGGAPAPGTTVPKHRNHERLWMLATIVCMALAAALALIRFQRPVSTEQAVKLSLLPPENRTLNSTIAVSPDGNLIAFVAVSSNGKSSLWIRPLDSLVARELPGTEDAIWPFWSPDSLYVGFFAQAKLKKIEISGGPPQVLCDVSGVSRGGAWNQHGVILFSPNPGDGLYRIPSTGGPPVPVTTIDSSRQETTHRFPFFLPDGKHFVYWLRSGQPEKTGIYLGSLDSNQKKLLTIADRFGMYAAPGYLVFVNAGTLMAQHFDLDKFQITGDRFPIAEQILKDPHSIGTTVFSVSDSDLLAFRSGNPNTRRVWFDRRGNQISEVSTEGLNSNVALSPDNKRIAVGMGDMVDIWLFELPDGTRSRFTFDPSDDASPVWSPDGQRIIFSSSRLGPYNLFQKPFTGGGETLLLQSSLYNFPTDWSPDGRFLVLEEMDPKTKTDLWILSMSGERKKVPFLNTQFVESQGRFSPDGRWIAYVSDESGQPEVYVQSFPATPVGGKWQISTEGASQPRWRQDGKELYYIAADRKLMAVDVKAGTTFEAGVSKALFEMRIPVVVSSASFRNDYAVAADGQKFLVLTAVEDTSSQPITVVLNWTDLLEN